jgi:hypothetical protein
MALQVPECLQINGSTHQEIAMKTDVCDLSSMGTSEGLPKLFEGSNVDFDKLLHTATADSASVTTEASSGKIESLVAEPSDVGADECIVQARTLGGTVHSFSGLLPEMPLSELKVRIADKLDVPAFAVRLVLDTELLECDVGHTIQSAGLAVPEASVVVLRCAVERSEWIRLFHDLVRAIQCKRSHDAKCLVDQGAGFDGDGNVLKAANRMHSPGDVTARHAEAGNTMLHLAIRERLSDLALFLIARGVDLEATNDQWRTPLVQAMITRQITLVDALLKAQVDVSKSDHLVNTALTYALRQDDDHLSARILRAGGDLHSPDDGSVSWQERSFHGVATMFRGSIVDLQSRQAGGFETHSPVMHACISRMPLTVLALLDLGASVCGTDAHGHTALHYAYEHEMTEVISALLDKGADATMPDEVGRLPHLGAQGLCEVDIVPSPRLNCATRFRWFY